MMLRDIEQLLRNLELENNIIGRHSFLSVFICEEILYEEDI